MTTKMVTTVPAMRTDVVKARTGSRTSARSISARSAQVVSYTSTGEKAERTILPL